jgi:hypothetical protein
MEKVPDYLGEIHESPHNSGVQLLFSKSYNAVVICDVGVSIRMYILEIFRSMPHETNGCLNKFVDKTIADTMRKHAENLCQPRRTNSRKRVLIILKKICL